MDRARLAKARHRKLWTLEEAAGRVGVNKTTLSRWEKGQSMPQPISLRKLCDVYETSLQALGLEVDEVAVDVSYAAMEEDTLFQRKDLTLRLMRLVWQWKSQNFRHAALQLQVAQELEETMNDDQDFITRRDALRRLALLPIEMSGLSALYAVLRSPTEEILAQCAAGISACWHLGTGKELTFAFTIVSRYIPTLTAIAQSSQTPQRKAAASLLAQCFLLKAQLSQHVGQSDENAVGFAVKAEQYAEAAEDMTLRILGARSQANAHDYADRSKAAQTCAEKAAYLLETAASPMVASQVATHVYAGLANYQAQNGHKQNAMTSLKKAHNAYFSQVDSALTLPLWIDYGQGNLLLHDGLVHFYLGLYKEACSSFEQIATCPASDRRETTRVEALLDQVLAEVQREDRPRDMDYCVNRWSQGLQGAITIQSQQRYNEALTIYTAMRAAWPGERQVKALKEQIMHW